MAEKEPLSPSLETSGLSLKKRNLQAQLDNWRICLQQATERQEQALDQLSDIDESKASLQVQLTDATDTITNASEYIGELETRINEIKIPDDMIEDPHTGLLCTINNVCGELTLDGDNYVGVQLDDTDSSTRWILSQDIIDHVVANKLYTDWKTLQTQYRNEIPDGVELSTSQEFTKAITTGWQPKAPSVNLLPVYQLHDGKPKTPFTAIVNKLDRDSDLLCVVLNTSNKRVELPLRAINKFPLSKKLWARWLTLRDECEFDLGLNFRDAEDYPYERMVQMRTDLAIPDEESPLRTPHSLEFATPPHKRARHE